MGCIVTIGGGRISEWHPFLSQEDARRDAGLPAT
jgi:hypothetical protein